MAKPVESIPLEQIIREISRKDLVFMGEYHNGACLQNELQIISALSKKRPIQLALEHFDESTQNLLDKYVSNGISFEEFCEQVKGKYPKEYSNSYRPLFEAIKLTKGNKLLAIGSEREERVEDMAKVIAQNLRRDYLTLVLVGQGHIGELGLPHKVQSLSGDKGVVIACELDSYLKDVCSKQNVEKGIIKANHPRNFDYVILGDL